jgi:guanylate cyclase soluble subunit beta
MNGKIAKHQPKLSDHIQFLITEIGPVTPKTPKTPSSVKFSKEFEREQPDDFELVASEPLVSPQIFCQVFPFHLMFDRSMKIVQAGKSVSRVIPRLAEENCNLLDVLEPVRPHIALSFQTILSHISTIYVLKTKPNTMLESDMFMRLKVSILYA